LRKNLLPKLMKGEIEIKDLWDTNLFT
jgi:hypothetical protein